MAQRRKAPDRQRDPERTQARILAAGTIEFAAHGYAGARVGAIAARAGVNKQLISYYFGGKEGLYRAITERWLQAQNDSEPGREHLSIAELAASFVAAEPEERKMAKLLLWEGLSADKRDPGAAVRAERMRAAVEDLRRRQAAGELPANLDVRHFLLIFMGAAIAPVALPHVVRSLFGADIDPSSTEFIESYAQQLQLLIERL